MAYNSATKPLALGKIAPTAGTPLRATANLVGSLVDPFLPYANLASRDDLPANKIEFRAPSANAGSVYIMIQPGPAALVAVNTTTLANVLRVLEPGESWSIGDYDRGSVYRVGEFCIDVDTTGDSVHGNADTV